VPLLRAVGIENRQVSFGGPRQDLVIAVVVQVDRPHLHRLNAAGARGANLDLAQRHVSGRAVKYAHADFAGELVQATEAVTLEDVVMPLVEGVMSRLAAGLERPFAGILVEAVVAEGQLEAHLGRCQRRGILAGRLAEEGDFADLRALRQYEPEGGVLQGGEIHLGEHGRGGWANAFSLFGRDEVETAAGPGLKARLGPQERQDPVSRENGGAANVPLACQPSAVDQAAARAGSGMGPDRADGLGHGRPCRRRGLGLGFVRLLQKTHQQMTDLLRPLALRSDPAGFGGEGYAV